MLRIALVWIPKQIKKSDELSTNRAYKDNLKYHSKINLIILIPLYWFLFYGTITVRNGLEFLIAGSKIQITSCFSSLFMIRNPNITNYTILCQTVLLLIIGIRIFNDHYLYEVIFWILSGGILLYFVTNTFDEEQAQHSLDKNRLLQSEIQLTSVLEQFPSGIAFYSKKLGYFYYNQILKNICLNAIETLKGPFSDENPSDKTMIEDYVSRIVKKQDKNSKLSTQIDELYDAWFEVKEYWGKTSKFSFNKCELINSNVNHYEIELDNEVAQYEIKYAQITALKESKALMIVFNDISETMKYRDAQVSEQMKTIMLWSISHELRSPLNQINGILSLIQPTLKKPEQLKYIKIANSSSELLRLKIDDILNYYEIETKTFKTEESAFNIRHNCMMLESLFMPIINSNMVKLRFFVEETIPEYISHDTSRIRGIMVNLISNSIKYTKQGIISVLFNFVKRSRNKIKITVSDSGWGIKDSKKKALFKFLDPNNINRNNEFTTTPLAGTGLGISQRIAQEIGTLIEYKSKEDVGSTFWFELNLNRHFESNIKRIPSFSKNLTSKKLISTPSDLFHNSLMKKDTLEDVKKQEPQNYVTQDFVNAHIKSKYYNENKASSIEEISESGSFDDSKYNENMKMHKPRMRSSSITKQLNNMKELIRKDSKSISYDDGEQVKRYQSIKNACERLQYEIIDFDQPGSYAGSQFKSIMAQSKVCFCFWIWFINIVCR